MEQKSFFSNFNSKTSFYIGLGSGIAVLLVVGFFVLLGVVLSDKDDSGAPDQVAVNNQPTLAVPTPSGGEAAADTNFEITDSDYIRGNPEAPITIVEFSDFECPFCARFKPSVDQALAEYPDDVRLVYKHFPLSSIHSQAQSAAEASECAGSLGGNDAFWEYHDLLFENQQSLGRDLYLQLAGQVGVNTSEFESCLDNGDFRGKVQQDYQRGITAGVRGTPGSFINGQSLPGAVPYEQVKQVIESLL